MPLSKESGNTIFPGTCSTTAVRERFKIIAENKIVDPVPEPPILSSSSASSFSCHWYEHAFSVFDDTELNWRIRLEKRNDNFNPLFSLVNLFLRGFSLQGPQKRAIRFFFFFFFAFVFVFFSRWSWHEYGIVVPCSTGVSRLK